MIDDQSKLTLQKIEEQVLTICKDTANCELSMSDHLVDEVGMDSLDVVELLMALEDKFGVEIPDDDVEELVTPKIIAQYIANKIDVYE